MATAMAMAMATRPQMLRPRSLHQLVLALHILPRLLQPGSLSYLPLSSALWQLNGLVLLQLIGATTHTASRRLPHPRLRLPPPVARLPRPPLQLLPLPPPHGVRGIALPPSPALVLVLRHRKFEHITDSSYFLLTTSQFCYRLVSSCQVHWCCHR